MKVIIAYKKMNYKLIIKMINNKKMMIMMMIMKMILNKKMINLDNSKKKYKILLKICNLVFLKKTLIIKTQ